MMNQVYCSNSWSICNIY